MNSILEPVRVHLVDAALAAPCRPGRWSRSSPVVESQTPEVRDVSDLLTVEDAAGRAHVHPETVKRAIRSGRLRASRLGERGAYRIREEWFDEWIDGQSVAVDASADDQRGGVVRSSRTRGRLAVGKGMGKVA
jgi:excisionase family DNA binding protein